MLDSVLIPGTFLVSHPSFSCVSKDALTAFPVRRDEQAEAHTSMAAHVAATNTIFFMKNTPDHRRLMQGSYPGVSLYIFLTDTTR
jgi:hypothetical protein